MEKNSEQLLNSLLELKQRISQVYKGPEQGVDRLLICLLAEGHALIEDVPGIGKTLLATTLAKSINGNISRIQCTPDLLPSDITGGSIYDRQKSEFTFIKGPVFSNVVIADEINRATPRCQAALLEAMNDKKVTSDGITRSLPSPFIVVATQNPIEFDGTYSLPENQLDRFLMRFSLGYPERLKEKEILRSTSTNDELETLNPIMTIEDISKLQKIAKNITIDDSILEWILDIATTSRRHDDLRVGLSTRATVAITNTARATALLSGRDYVTPDDLLFHFECVCSHRIVSSAHALDQDRIVNKNIIEEIISKTPSPI